MKTELKNRTLWFDGTSQVSPELVPDLLLMEVPIEKIVVTDNNDDILQFNALSEEPIANTKTGNDPFLKDWQVPEKYLKIDLAEYVGEKLLALNLPEDKLEIYARRTDNELAMIKKMNMDKFFRTLIYVVETLKSTKTVWGVGRGSSCASLVLYLIGLHKVDPVKFNIDMTEFFHD